MLNSCRSKSVIFFCLVLFLYIWPIYAMFFIDPSDIEFCPIWSIELVILKWYLQHIYVIVLKVWMQSWVKLQTHIVTTIQDFNQTSMSCKQKYKTVLTNYRNNKRLHEILEESRLFEYKWLYEMNFLIWFKNKFKNKCQKSNSYTYN